MRRAILNPQQCTAISRAAFLLLFSVINFTATRAEAQQQILPAGTTQKPLRELFVPFEEIDVLLGNDTRRVYLTRDEYEELRAKSNVTGTQVAPTKVTLLSANYNAEIGDGRATIRGELIVEVLEKGVQVLPLGFSGVGIRTAKLDETSASIAKNDAGQTLLFVEGVGKHQLTLDLVMPVATDAAQQTLQFQIPTAATGELQMTVPGNIEIKSGAAVISREVDASADSTRFKILPSATPMSMVMSLNNKKLRDQSTLVARGVVIAEITQAYERLHATMSMGVLNGAVDEFRFAVDDDLEVNSVSCELMNRWSIDKVDGQQQLVVHLRTPATEREVINIRLDRVTRKLESWRMPSFQPLNIAGYSSVVGLLSEDRLRVSAIEPESLIAIDSKLLIAALPASLMASEPGTPKLNAVAAYYAAQSEFALTAQFAVKTPRVIVASTLLLSVTDRGLDAEGGFTLMPQNEKLFVFDFECPRAWTIDRVKAGEQNLKFDRFEPAADADADAPARVRVALPSGVAPGGQLTVTFHALQTPPDWLTKWDSQSLAVPNFRVLAAENQFGGIAVQIQDDLLLTPEATQGLLVMNAEEEARFQIANADPAVAYRFESADWSATLKVTRVAPRTVAQVHSFVQLTNDAMVSHTEIGFDVKQSRLQTVEFTLPESTPAEISIRGLGGTVVKETTSNIVDERRVWTVQLAERKAGLVRLAVDFTQPLNTQNAVELTLPIARAAAVDYQSGAIAVEGHSELEVEMLQSPRSVDIGELVDAEYQVGKRLIGVYGYVGNDDRAVARISRRPVHRLPTTIVERAELVTLVSAQGVCQTASRFRLRTKAAYIETALPDEALLWSVMLDGKPALPQREGDKVLIAIPAAGQSTQRDLQLVYESKSSEVSLRGRLGVMAPELSEREDVQSEELPIPIADVKWDLVLPHGYTVTWTGGNLSPTNQASRRFSISKLLERIWEFGGGGSLNSAFHSTGVSSNDWDALPKHSSAREPSQIAPQSAASAPAKKEMDAPLPEVRAMEMPFGPVVVPNDTTAAILAAPSQIPPASDSELSQSKNKESDKKKFWAMEGVRSLEIELKNSTASETHSMSSLGATPTASVAIINQARLQWLAILVGVAVFVIGLVWLPRRRIARVRYFSAVILIALLAPPVTGYTVELEPVCLAMLLGLIAIAAALLVGELVKRLAIRVDERSLPVAVKSSATAPVTTIVLSLILGCSVQAVAIGQAEQAPGQIVADAAELARLLRGLDDGGKVSLPNDAVIIPFDPANSMDVALEGKLLLPYDKYVELWNLANPTKPLEDPTLPAKFAWSSANYRVTLDARDSLQMSATIAFELFTDNEVAIPLNLNGCVIEEAKLDGHPPRLQMVSAQPAAEQAQVQQNAQPANMLAPPSAMYLLYARGKGRKQLELQLRWQLDKRSGWRAVEGSLPATPASELKIQVPKANTEVRLAGAADRGNFETSKDDEQIVTTLGVDGRLSLNWRDKITEASIDQGLTVQARSVFDIQEDALKLAWHGQFDFRRGRRESFTLQVPKDYIVEKIVGANIRGWTVKPTDAGQQVDVELLKAVSDRETLVLFISKQNAIDAQAATPVTVPQIVVPDAMLHQGHVAVRRSLLLDVRAESTVGLTRIEALDESSWLNAHEVAGILPIKVYQAYRYSQVPYDLRVVVNPVASKVSAQSQTLLKISQLERTLETRLLITSSDRARYRLQIGLPAEWKMQAPEVPGNFQWSLTPAGDRQLMDIYLADGQSNEFPVILRGEISGETQPNAPIALPKIEVIGALRQSGAIVVQADPAYDVRAESLVGCEPALLDSVKSWLNDKQRAAARVAVRFEGPQYSGQLQVAARTPEVSSYSVTNVKVTDRAIEETLFIEASIRFAGIREFVFLMPADLASARIQAPHVQQKIIQPAEDNAAMVRVRLLLQDAIMGQFRVVVERDRELTSGPHAAPLPVIETGTTDRRLVTLENVGRDELVTDQVVSFEPLDRSQLLQRFQADLLGGRSSQAYLAREAAREPLLTFATKSREVLATAGARIGLAQTLLVIDELGTYRATQEYRVENRTEPFLEIELPEKARMWTVQVAGEPVKPAVVTSSSKRVRIPLIKTAEGDLDYPVVIKYGGSTSAPSLLSRVQFPLIHTLNINVELSQVRLRLPESFDWFNFHGTLGRVQSESDLQAGWLSYRTRQLTELSQLLSSQKSVSDYTRARALNNLSELESTIQQRNYEFAQNAEQSQELGKQLSSNSAALKIAQQQAAQVAQVQTSEGRGNRALLNDLYGSQSNGRSYNALGDLGQNFSTQTPLADPQVAMKGMENTTNESQNKWFKQNKLDSKPTDEVSRLQIEEKFEQAPQSEAGQAQLAVPFQQYFDSGAIAGKKLDSVKQQDEAKDSQAERYNQRLQRQRGKADDYGNQAAMRGVIESADRANQPGLSGGLLPPPGQPDPNAMGMGTLGGVRGGGASGGDQLFGVARDANQVQLSNGLALNVPATAPRQGPSLPQVVVPPAAYMASLDVELPVRGREYFFTTPRGDVELSGQAVAIETYQRLYTILIVLVATFGVWCVYLLTMKLMRTNLGSAIVGLTLACFGAFALMQGLVPIYGVLALVAAAVLVFVKLDARAAPTV